MLETEAALCLPPPPAVIGLEQSDHRVVAVGIADDGVDSLDGYYIIPVKYAEVFRAPGGIGRNPVKDAL